MPAGSAHDAGPRLGILLLTHSCPNLRPVFQPERLFQQFPSPPPSRLPRSHRGASNCSRPQKVQGASPCRSTVRQGHPLCTTLGTKQLRHSHLRLRIARLGGSSRRRSRSTRTHIRPSCRDFRRGSSRFSTHTARSQRLAVPSLSLHLSVSPSLSLCKVGVGRLAICTWRAGGGVPRAAPPSPPHGTKPNTSNVSLGVPLTSRGKWRPHTPTEPKTLHPDHPAATGAFLSRISWRNPSLLASFPDDDQRWTDFRSHRRLLAPIS